MKLVARVIPILALALVVGAVLALTVFKDKPGPPGSLTEKYEAWPDDVLPLVLEVERERGLDFRHPVEIDFLAPAEFEMEFEADEEELSDQDREDLEETVDFFRALGLVDDDVDLFEETQKLQQAGVVGYYSFEDEKIRVRGSKLTPSTRSTLVHELTHALQDQSFGIGEVMDGLREEDDGTAAGIYRALFEGDASRVENAYRAGLSKAEQTELGQADAADGQEFAKRSQDIPPILITLLGAPYALGTGLLDLAVAVDDNDAVDVLFRTPPTSDEQLLDPWTIVVDKEAGEPIDVEAPPLGDGEEEFDSGSFGALGWYVVLAQRLDPKVALRATDGWGGDQYSAFERDGRSCLRIAYEGDTRQDVAQLASALESWIAQDPTSALLQRTPGGLVFASCESDADVAPLAGQDVVLRLPVARTTIASQVIASGAPTEFGRCYAQRVIDGLTLEEIASNDPEVVQKAQALGQECLEG